MTKWGLVSTIKAPASEILDFAAYHLDLGAHRLFIYLDEPNETARTHLKAHPKVRVFTCDAAHWKKLGLTRPSKHQPRQTANATHAYGRKPEVDWLIHMDVDEFLWPDAPMDQILSRLSDGTLCARTRPIEALSGDGSLFKAFIPSGPDRDTTVERLYPTFGHHVKGGFMSHLAGKLFVRTGLGDVRNKPTFKIHNVFLGNQMNPGETELDDVALCHCHAKSWDDWRAALRFRHARGSYRAELAPSRPRDKGGMTLHELLSEIEADGGETGLRAFYDELCAATPRLTNALRAEGLLRECNLQLAARRRKHFQNFTNSVSTEETK